LWNSIIETYKKPCKFPPKFFFPNLKKKMLSVKPSAIFISDRTSNFDAISKCYYAIYPQIILVI